MKTALTGRSPCVLFIDFPEHLVGLFKFQLEKFLTPLFYTSRDLEDKLPQLKTENIHRVVVFFNIFGNEDLTRISQALTETKSNITAVFPFVPNFSQPKNGVGEEGLISNWGLLLDQQQALYKRAAAIFPTAQFLFYEGLSLAGCPTSLPCLLLAKIGENIIFEFKKSDQQISLIFEKDFCLSLVELIKKPFKSQATLIRSAPVEIKTFIDKVKGMHHKLFSRELKTVVCDVSPSQDTPITSELVVLTRDENLLAYSRLYGGGFFKTAAALSDFLKSNPNLFSRTTKVRQSHPPSFGQQVGTLFDQVRKQQKQEHFFHIAKVETKVGKKNKGRKIFFIGGILSACLATYMIFYAWKFNSAYQKYQTEINQVIQTQLDKLELCDNGWTDIEKQGEFIHSTAKTWGKVLSHPLFDQAKAAELVMTQLVKFCTEQKTKEDKKGLIYQHILSQSNYDLLPLLDEYERVYQNFTIAQQDLLTSIDSFRAAQQTEPDTSAPTEDADDKTNNLGLFKLFKPELKEILGLEDQKTYVLIFQDSAELRPTGGFVSGVVFLNVQNGQLNSYYAKGAYEISRMVPELVVPPANLTEALKEKNWYFHDSNWDPNFSSSGKTMSWFIEKATDIKPDGVIGVTTNGLRSILSIIGPVVVEGFDQQVTADNLAEVLDNYAKLGVDQSQNFISSLLKAVIGQIYAQNTEVFGSVVGALVGQLNQNQAQFWFQDEQVQKIITNLGWGGDISPPHCLAQFTDGNCLADAVFQVETNIGVNRVNPEIKTTTTDVVEFTQERINRKRIVTWENTTTNNIWPKGNYKAYVRWYLPKNALFADLLIDGQSQLGSNLKLSYENERLVVATTIEIGVGARLSAELNYYLTSENQTNLAYMYINQIQPGQNQPEQQLSIIYPTGWRLIKISPNPTEKLDGKLSFLLGQENYGVVGVEFSSVDSH